MEGRGKVNWYEEETRGEKGMEEREREGGALIVGDGRGCSDRGRREGGGGCSDRC